MQCGPNPESDVSQIFFPEGYSARPMNPADEVKPITYVPSVRLYLSLHSSMLVP